MTVRATSSGKRRAVSCISDGNTGAQPKPMSTSPKLAALPNTPGRANTRAPSAATAMPSRTNLRLPKRLAISPTAKRPAVMEPKYTDTQMPACACVRPRSVTRILAAHRPVPISAAT